MAAGALCLIAAGALVALPPGPVELRWTHSIEKLTWREVWTADPAGGLRAVHAAAQGLGAGLDPPADAHWIDGWIVWTPTTRVPTLTLTRGGVVADWVLTAGGESRPLGAWLGSVTEGDAVLAPCGP